MTQHLKSLAVAMAFAVAASGVRAGGPDSTAFVYQGQLALNGVPVSASTDFEFSLWTDDVAGRQIGSTISEAAVDVKNGLFQVTLDFGAGSLAGPRWLAISVRSSRTLGGFEPILPRQQVASSPYSIHTRGIHVTEAGNVGIGTASPQAKLHVDGGTDISPTGGGYLQVGPTDSRHLAMDGNEIRGRGSDGMPITLLLNPSGGDVQVSGGGDGRLAIGGVPELRLNVYGGTDAHPSGGGFLQCGDTDGTNVVMDDDEIMARMDGSASTLSLNANGGDVFVGGVLDIGIQIVEGALGTSPVAFCPTGKRALSGGCDGGVNEVLESIPLSNAAGWSCEFNGEGIPFAVCARVK